MVPMLLAAALAVVPWPRVALSRVAAGFSNPTQVTSARDGSGRLFVVEQRGVVKIVKNGAVLPTPFLDISNRVSCCGERGLLSIVFPPGSGPKGAVLTRTTRTSTATRRSRVFYVSGDPDVARLSETDPPRRSRSRSRTTTAGSSRSGPTGISTSAWVTAGARATR